MDAAQGKPEKRDRSQAATLVWSVTPLLALACAALLFQGQVSSPRLLAAGATATIFAAIVRALRAGTTGAAVAGGMICFLIMLGAGTREVALFRTGVAPLLLLFVLTFAATRAARRPAVKKRRDEERNGRNAAQVIANLGATGLVAGSTHLGSSISTNAAPVALLAILVEATADTVSSEMGQRFGGTPRMLTTLRRVAPGTDGAVSLLGSAYGCLGGALVAGAGMWGMRLNGRQTLYALLGGLAGWLFDSLLGATLERRGWLGNDLVNFASTVFAAIVACALMTLF